MGNLINYIEREKAAEDLVEWLENNAFVRIMMSKARNYEVKMKIEERYISVVYNENDSYMFDVSFSTNHENYLTFGIFVNNQGLRQLLFDVGLKPDLTTMKKFENLRMMYDWLKVLMG